ncbi:MAG: hypothetical protein QXI12_07080 [Candidatus Methanomethyliaceae archaeon]
MREHRVEIHHDVVNKKGDKHIVCGSAVVFMCVFERARFRSSDPTSSYLTIYRRFFLSESDIREYQIEGWKGKRDGVKVCRSIQM